MTMFDKDWQLNVNRIEYYFKLLIIIILKAMLHT